MVFPHATGLLILAVALAPVAAHSQSATPGTVLEEVTVTASRSPAEQRLDAARLALSQAIEIEPDYADPQCFLAIIEFQFRDDADAALPYVERCEASNPPGEIGSLVANFAEQIRAAAG